MKYGEMGRNRIKSDKCFFSSLKPSALIQLWISLDRGFCKVDIIICLGAAPHLMFTAEN
jgi:hypothetical protein